MKKFVVAVVAFGALMSAPAFAGGTHINVGFYSPAPVYHRPAPAYYAPVAYYPPVQHVYYAPRPVYYTKHKHKHHRGYNVAWNDRGHHRGWNGHR